MDAQVTLKVSPAEFDLLREALDSHAERMLRTGNDQNFTAEQRRNAKAQALRTRDLIEKVR